MKFQSAILRISAALTLAYAVSANGTDLSGISGSFADIGLGLRPVGMGGAYTALASDENAARWNPSLLANIYDPLAGFSWAKQFNLISYNYISAAYPIGQTMGVGAYFISSGDEVYRETTIGLAGGVNGKQFKIPDMFSFGGTLKIYTASYGNDASGGVNRVTGSAFGYGLDLAASAQVTDEIVLSVVGRDLINSINWDSSVDGKYAEGVPRTIVFAGGYQDEKMAISFDLQPSIYDDAPGRFELGTELTLFGVLKPRVGMMQNLGSSDANRWLTLGMGVDLEPRWLGPIRIVRFGYTHFLHDIDSTPRVGLTIGW